MVITMKKLNDFFEKHFIPFAVKLNNIKGLIAIRDAFIQIFPLTFVVTAHREQYLARLEPGTKAAPHTVQRRVGRMPFRSDVSNAGSLGSTAYRNHLQTRAPECHWGQTLQWGSSKRRQASPSKLQHRFRIRDRT